MSFPQFLINEQASHFRNIISDSRRQLNYHNLGNHNLGNLERQTSRTRADSRQIIYSQFNCQLKLEYVLSIICTHNLTLNRVGAQLHGIYTYLSPRVVTLDSLLCRARVAPAGGKIFSSNLHCWRQDLFLESPLLAAR